MLATQPTTLNKLFVPKQSPVLQVTTIKNKPIPIPKIKSVKKKVKKTRRKK